MQPSLSNEQALALLSQATASVVANREQHQVILQALQVLQALVASASEAKKTEDK